jgi:hypothetical protein
MVEQVTTGVLVTLLIKLTIVTTVTSVTNLRGAISFRTNTEKTLLSLAGTSTAGCSQKSVESFPDWNKDVQCVTAEYCPVKF